jgi:WD40 repeat protein
MSENSPQRHKEHKQNHQGVFLWVLCFLVMKISTLNLATAQQPTSPPLPSISPNLARLDQTLGGLDGPGFALAYSESVGTLAAACEGQSIHYWDKVVIFGIRGGSGTPHVLKEHQGPVTALAWSRGQIMASAGIDKKIVLWHMPDGAIQERLPTDSIIRALVMSPDGKMLVGAGEDPAIYLWDLAASKPSPRKVTKFAGGADWVLSLAFSNDSQRLASGGYDGTVRLWEVPTVKKLLDIAATLPAPANSPAPPTNVILSLAFSPDGKQLAIGGTDAQIHLFNTTDGKLGRSIAGHTSSVTGLAFHASGTVLASCSKDRTVRLWNPTNGQPLTAKPLEGHTAWVQGVVFVAEGTRLASIGADQTVRLWNLK